jgi:hypothetical protein
MPPGLRVAQGFQVEVAARQSVGWQSSRIKHSAATRSVPARDLDYQIRQT